MRLGVLVMVREWRRERRYTPVDQSVGEGAAVGSIDGWITQVLAECGRILVEIYH